MTAETSPSYKVAVRSMLDHSQSEFNELFTTLSAPKPNELNGVYKGSLMAIIGLNWLPRIARVVLYRFLQTFIIPWSGKRFDGERGANVWFTLSGNYCFGRYTIEDNYIAEDGQPVTRLCYDVTENLGILKPIRGEVRKLNDGLFLARMHYKTRKQEVRVLYFTLEADNG